MFLVKLICHGSNVKLHKISELRNIAMQYVQRLPFSTLLKTNGIRTWPSSDFLLLHSARFISKKTTKLPFQADRLTTSAKRDMIVYSYKNDRFFRTLTVFGGIQLMFWANLGYFFCSVPMARLSRPHDETSNETISGSWSVVFSDWLSRHQSRVGGACFALGNFIYL